MTTISTGTVVCLKSRGPAMTVLHIDNDGIAQCGWFHEGILSKAQFPVTALDVLR